MAFPGRIWHKKLQINRRINQWGGDGKRLKMYKKTNLKCLPTSYIADEGVYRARSSSADTQVNLRIGFCSSSCLTVARTYQDLYIKEPSTKVSKRLEMSSSTS